MLGDLEDKYVCSEHFLDNELQGVIKQERHSDKRDKKRGSTAEPPSTRLGEYTMNYYRWYGSEYIGAFS